MMGAAKPRLTPRPKLKSKIESGESAMTDYSALSLAELEDRIAIVRDNIRQLIEQAAGASGDRNEERISDRLAHQNTELESLSKARDALSGKR
jgi:uncharacterized small protein (DUF1192 family)